MQEYSVLVPCTDLEPEEVILRVGSSEGHRGLKGASRERKLLRNRRLFPCAQKSSGHFWSKAYNILGGTRRRGKEELSAKRGADLGFQRKACGTCPHMHVWTTFCVQLGFRPQSRQQDARHQGLHPMPCVARAALRCPLTLRRLNHSAGAATSTVFYICARPSA